MDSRALQIDLKLITEELSTKEMDQQPPVTTRDLFKALYILLKVCLTL